MIFGRTDLRIGGAEAKFDVEADGGVRLVAAPLNPHKISEKLIFRLENFRFFVFSTSKNETLRII